MSDHYLREGPVITECDSDQEDWYQLLIAHYKSRRTVQARALVMGLSHIRLNSKEEYPLLQLVAEVGDLASFRLLLNRGIDPNVTDHAGRTAGHVAASKGHLTLLKTWRVAGGHLQAQDDFGQTLIHHACRSDCQDTLFWLVEQGCDINALTQVGENALHIAIRAGGSMMMVNALCRAGVHLNQADRDGNTPLHISVELALPAVAMGLLERQADPTLVNDYGLTADAMLPENTSEAYDLAAAFTMRQRWSVQLLRSRAG